MLDTSAPPIVPQRTSARTSPGGPKDRRRRSLPTTSHRNDRRRDSNRINVKPASTEVISSLIETLSAISTPAEHHFDSLPNISASHSTPVSPRPWQSDFPTITTPIDNDMQGSQRISVPKRPHGIDAAYLLHPDRPSLRGSSPKHSPVKTTFNGSAGAPQDPYDLGGMYSIGNVSIESKPGQSTISVDSTGSETRKKSKGIRSIRSIKSLKFMNSRDSLRSGDEKVIQKPKDDRDNNRQRIVITETPPSSPPPNQSIVSKGVVRNDSAVDVPNVPDRTSSVRSVSTPKRLYWNAADVTGESDKPDVSNRTPSQEFIPMRDSSKRQSAVGSLSQRNRSSRVSDRSSTQEPISTEVDCTASLVTSGKTADVSGSEGQVEPNNLLDHPEDLVTRRIKELKDRKLQRERLSFDASPSLESPSAFFSAPQTPDPNRSPCPLPAIQQANVYPFPEIESKSTITEADGKPSEASAETSAPSPAIAQRSKRNSLIGGKAVGSRPVARRDPPSQESKRRSFSLPQRSNSRLLKRLSRPPSPSAGERHSRTFSNLSMQEKRGTFYPFEDDGDSIDDAVEDYISSPRLSQRINHPQTGRVISFSEVGDPEGSAVFCCVGMGLTRFLTAFYDELASTLKLRLITPDRPGVGGSETHADGLDTPLGWPDDVRAICAHLRITKFSILAHSAGAIYALATALRMSQHIRCRVHLLAPWIPPSQMSVIGAQQDPLPASSLPYSQRILRALPTTFLRAANSSFLSTTSASVTTSLTKSPRRTKQRSERAETVAQNGSEGAAQSSYNALNVPKLGKSDIDSDQMKENKPPNMSNGADDNLASRLMDEKKRSSSYESRLTDAIWSAATTSANPAVDLLVCLERRQPIGFRYVDITRAVVIHHGSKDTRVPVENVKWLGNMMRRCEVRVLDGQGHGLMANAGVMGNVLMEMAQEWDDWNRVVKGKRGFEKRGSHAV